MNSDRENNLFRPDKELIYSRYKRYKIYIAFFEYDMVR